MLVHRPGRQACCRVGSPQRVSVTALAWLRDAPDLRPGDPAPRLRRAPHDRARTWSSAQRLARPATPALPAFRRGAPTRYLARNRSDPGSSRLAFRRAARRSRHGHSGRAESDKAPPCMRWRGPARPRLTGWSVAWPCRRRAPPAGARHPYKAPVSRLLPRSRGRPQVVPVSSGGIFLLHTRAPRKSLRPAISGFLRYPRRNPQNASSYPPFTAVIHGLFTAYPQPGNVSRGTPGLPSPDVTG